MLPVGCDGISTVKFSLFGRGKGLPELLIPPMERGESPVDEGDILSLCRLNAVSEAVARAELMGLAMQEREYLTRDKL